MDFELHHLKYKEIDGVDETILLPIKIHKKLHRELKRERIPKNIMNNAMSRNYKNTHKIERLRFSNRLDKMAFLCEEIEYNLSNGNVYYSWYLRGNFYGKSGRYNKKDAT